MSTHGTDLPATLRAWRDRMTPGAAGLPSGRARRAKGLRREELAELAGISVDYLVRLEQGRSSAPSAQVVKALARALRLTEDERDHLYRLTGHAPPPRTEVTDTVPPGLHRLLDRLGDTAAAAVFAADWQLARWNRAWAALLGDPEAVAPPLRNFARDTFPVDSPAPHLSHWPVASDAQDAVEAAVVADLRRATGRYPASERLSTLVDDLASGNARFAELWASGGVGAHREDRKTVEHPRTGPIAVDCDVLTEGAGERKLVVLTADPDTEDGVKFRLVLAGAADPH